MGRQALRFFLNRARRRTWLLALTLIACLLTSCAAPSKYAAIRSLEVPEGFTATKVSGMSDTSLAGVLTDGASQRAFRWGDDGVEALTRPDGGSWATAVNNEGQVVGSAHTKTDLPRAVLWHDGQLTDLGTLGGERSEATAINDLGQVAGVSEVRKDSKEQHAFLWQGGEMTDLGTLGGAESRANAISEQGQVAGQAQTEQGTWQAFVWETGAMSTLAPLGDYASSAATGINGEGQVVGYVETEAGEDGPSRAVLWVNGNPTDLGSLGGDGGNYAYGISDTGQVVGRSQDASGNDRAFLWAAGTMTDLNALIGPALGWELTSALAINEAGQIVGLGTIGGEERSFLLTLPGMDNPQSGKVVGIH